MYSALKIAQDSISYIHYSSTIEKCMEEKEESNDEGRRNENNGN